MADCKNIIHAFCQLRVLAKHFILLLGLCSVFSLFSLKTYHDFLPVYWESQNFGIFKTLVHEGGLPHSNEMYLMSVQSLDSTFRIAILLGVSHYCLCRR